MAHYKDLFKFGGKSLTNISAFAKVDNLLQQAKPQLIIVSALGSTTANLLEVLQLAAEKQEYHTLLAQVIEQHLQLAEALLANSQAFRAAITKDAETLQAMLQTTAQLGSYDNSLKDYILSLGEYWSSELFAQYCSLETEVIDATKILVIDNSGARLLVDWQATQENLQFFLKQKHAKHLIITGFICANQKGQRATLGFEGSDYSAAIFGRLFDVEKITIWTDVDGIFTANPTKVKDATVISELSYNEAFELAYFGASIIHPHTIQPAMVKNIPIRIANIFKSQQAGTLILAKPRSDNNHHIRGISCLEHVSLISVEGTGMLGACGTAAKIFDILSRANISVLLISQVSSEHSICFVVKDNVVQQAYEALQEWLALDLNRQLVQSIVVKKDCSVLSIVGEPMIGMPGNSARLLGYLAQANINVKALSQGANERNISVVIDSLDCLRAINTVHTGFYLSKPVVQIGLIGPGNVGQAFLKQFLENKQRLEQELNITLNLKAIASSTKMSFIASATSVAEYMSTLLNSKQKLDYQKFIKALAPNHFTHSVVVDCTASESLTDLYPSFIELGCHIITPNKKATSGSFKRFKKIKALCSQTYRHFLYETNVCAGLPVIKTLQDLIATGDIIYKVQGVFSGTLSYLFNEVSSGVCFSKALNTAYELGLTEPDPRDDLNGMDVARKCVCLARELGYQIELSEVEIRPILPESLLAGTVEEFLSQRKQMDQVFESKLAQLKKSAKKLVYSGTITEQGKVCLELAEVDQKSPFYNLKGTDNMVIYHTKRYDQYPLVIQGPGAGAEVTAAGVFADLLRLVDLTAHLTNH